MMRIASYRGVAMGPRRPLSSAATVARRPFMSNPFGRKQVAKIRVDESVYDKQNVHYTGKLFGVPMDTLMYYGKVNGSIAAICGMLYMFFKGYAYLTTFSLATVGRLGFMSGFFTCGLLYTTALAVRRRVNIAPNAVYNQAIALALRNPEVVKFLGPSPRTGDFRAYCASGGFKLPLMRRLRSGQYEMSDLLGTKPRRLQMIFVLRSPEGKEGLVACDVRKTSVGVLDSGFYFHSLSVNLVGQGEEPNTSIVMIGRPEDAVCTSLLNL